MCLKLDHDVDVDHPSDEDVFHDYQSPVSFIQHDELESVGVQDCCTIFDVSAISSSSAGDSLLEFDGYRTLKKSGEKS